MRGSWRANAALGGALAFASACGSTEHAPRRSAGSAGECQDCARGGEGGDSLEPVNEGGASAGVESGGMGTAPLGGDAGQAGAAPVTTPEIVLGSISVLQTLEVPLMQAGSALPLETRAVPLVAGKSSLFRATIQLAPDFASRPLLGVLDLKTASTTRSIVSRLAPTESSLPDDLATSFTFAIDPSDLTPTSSYRVRVLEADTTPLARFPETGFADLDARAMQPFEVVLVPFVANGFTPLTGGTELEALRRRLVQLYPLTEVELSVAAPVKLNYVVNGDGDGWDTALNQIYDVRSAAAPAQNVFYFAMLAPDASYDAYCANGCILGYSNIADPDDIDSRGALGVTVFPDGSGADEAWDTVAHELGHALGRDHAPCDVRPDDVDPAWPSDMAHRNAALGAYGYDFEQALLVKPRSYRDVMSYCTPQWVSDYTYQGLFERLAHIQAQAFRALAWEQPEPFRLARIGRRGDVSWLGERIKRGTAARVELDLLDAQGRKLGVIEAQVAHAEQSPAAFVWLPQKALLASRAVWLDLRSLGGDLLAL